MNRRSASLLLALPLLTACDVFTAGLPEGAMDEVPTQRRLASGERQYGFRSGCIIVVEPVRAVVTSEGGACRLYHRDIALLHAAGD